MDTKIMEKYIELKRREKEIELEYVNKKIELYEEISEICYDGGDSIYNDLDTKYDFVFKAEKYEELLQRYYERKKEIEQSIIVESN